MVDSEGKHLLLVPMVDSEGTHSLLVPMVDSEGICWSLYLTNPPASTPFKENIKRGGM
jgi:hypothetical protein